jgi:hypothetical protein
MNTSTDTAADRRRYKSTFRASAKLGSVLDGIVETCENVSWVPNAPMMAAPGVFQHAIFVNGDNVRIQLDTNKREARIIRTGIDCKPHTTRLASGLNIFEIAMMAVN